MVLAIILFIVTLLCVLSVLRQVKFKNYFALAFSAVAALSFGFFSVATILCSLTDAGFCT
ncbi:MAG TPA: DUF2759 family protein [Pseudogracilibacillus sp.]|nr:DUF2759 family protein [Pseudogracilibacillus sp.]